MPDRNQPSHARDGDPLTPREHEVLSLLTAGTSTDEIAARLGITPAAVRNHRNSVYRKIGARPARASGRDALTQREQEILALLAAGNTTSEIAVHLGITAGTVKTHLTSIYKKIGAKNRVHAVRYYLDHVAPGSDA